MIRQRRKQIITSFLVLAIIVFAGLNSVRFFKRIDLTENRVYTISRVSRELFKEIPEIVHITYYRSDKLDDLSPIPRLVEDLLQEYTAHSRGRISMEVVDPAATGQEQSVEMMGLIPQQVEVVERNERSVARIYSGIVVRYL
ncbi:MAG: Gldg family protein, partial [Spirochaetia bacterium]